VLKLSTYVDRDLSYVRLRRSLVSLVASMCMSLARKMDSSISCLLK